MKFEYIINGITLDMADMVEIHKYYEAACTAEYLMDNYEITKGKALECGYKIRRLMSKYGFTEEQAIDEVLKEVDNV